MLMRVIQNIKTNGFAMLTAKPDINPFNRPAVSGAGPAPAGTAIPNDFFSAMLIPTAHNTAPQAMPTMRW